MNFMLPLLSVTGIFSELFGDFNLIIKIFVFLTIMNFVKNNMGNSLLSVIVALAISYFVFFVAWPLFGSIYLIYILLMVGISGVIVDFFFVTGQGGGEAPPGQEEYTPVSSGVDIANRQAGMQQARRGR